MEEKRLLIFGTGFLAENYIQYLRGTVRKKFTIKVLYNRHKLQFAESNIEQIPLDSETTLFLETFKPNYILCLYGNSFVPAIKSVRESMASNALKTMDFLEAISLCKPWKSLEKILVVGSASEYGKYYHKPIREDFPLHATSLYGLSKISLYNASMFYYERGLPIVHLRQFNTIGPFQRDCFVLPSFCKQIAEVEKGIRKPEIMIGDLTQERDFIDVRDTSRAYSLLFEKGCQGEVYNVSSGKYTTIKKLLDLVLDVSHIKDDIKLVRNEKLFYKENRLCKRLHADISKLRKLGFELKYPLRETVNATLDYWRKNV